MEKIEHNKARTGNPIPLALIVRNEALRQRLEELRITHAADLWMLVALEQYSSEVSGIRLLHTLATHLARTISPFRPHYCIDYSIVVRSEGHGADSHGLPNLDACVTTYRAEMRLPTGTLLSHAIVPFMPEDRLGPRTGEKNLATEIMTCLELDVHHYTSPPALGWQELVRPVKLPLLAEVLDAIEKTGPRRREVIVRRRGLVSGEVETLEKIAVDLHLTRERVRQLESKTVSYLLSRKGFSRSLSLALTEFEHQIRVWLSKLGNTASGQEILEQFGQYFNFNGFQPSPGMAFLCEAVNLIARPLRRDGDVWFASLSEADYSRIVKVYCAVNDTDLDGTGTTTTLGQLKDVRIITKTLGSNAIETIQTEAKRLIGATKVMRFNEFVTGLIGRCQAVEIPGRMWESHQRARQVPDVIDSRFLATLAGVSVVPAAEYERIALGEWVTCDLTKRAQAVVRAIIYGGANWSAIESKVAPEDCLKSGIPSEFIIEDVANRSGFYITEQALDELCRRNSDVFVRTGPRSWGLIGAGAMASQDDISRSVVQQVRIIDALTEILLQSPEGYLISGRTLELS
jgi:hypothetical protein